MTREMWEAFKAAFAKIREGASDELALDCKELYPAWNGEKIYEVGDRVRDGEDFYKRIQPQVAPEIYAPHEAPALWVKVSVDEYLEWIKPKGAHDAYMTGDKVSHIGKHWTSTLDYNTYEPSVYGWDEVTR